MRNRTEHGYSWLTAISDAGSTPAASTIIKLLVFSSLSSRVKSEGHFVRDLYVAPFDRVRNSGQSHLKKWEPDAAFRLYPSFRWLQILTRSRLPPMQLSQMDRQPDQRLLLSPKRQDPPVGSLPCT